MKKVFCIFLIATYAIGFNLLCSYNLQSTFMDYSFYNPAVTPLIIGCLLAIITGYCLMGGGNRIVKVTSTVVPFMGISYVIVALIVILFNYANIPSMFVLAFSTKWSLSIRVFRLKFSRAGSNVSLYHGWRSVSSLLSLFIIYFSN